MVPCQHAFQAANGLETKPNPPHSISILASPMEPPQLTSLATGTKLNQTAHALALIQTKPSSFMVFANCSRFASGENASLLGPWRVLLTKEVLSS